jgi:hypothetical protein
LSYFHLGSEAEILDHPVTAPASEPISGLRVIEIERLCHSEAVSKAAFSASNILIEKGFIRWPAACWDEPAIAVIDGNRCVAAINWSRDDKQRYASVDFAFCDGSKPQALAMCILRARKRLAEAGIHEVRFAHHEGNEQMAKLAHKLRLRPHSISYRVPVRSAA